MIKRDKNGLLKSIWVGKEWRYCTIRRKGETMDNRKIQSQTDQDGDRIASDEACQKPFNRKTKERK